MKCYLIITFFPAQVVGEALLWTLGQGLGDAFTREVRDAWGLFYKFVGDCMKKGLNESYAAAASMWTTNRLPPTHPNYYPSQTITRCSYALSFYFVYIGCLFYLMSTLYAISRNFIHISFNTCIKKKCSTDSRNILYIVLSLFAVVNKMKNIHLTDRQCKLWNSNHSNIKENH